MTMFNVAGQQGNIPCTVSGTNTLTATPNTNYYLPAAYTNGQIISFKAAATSSGLCTIQVGGLPLVNLFTAAGVQAASGDLVLNNHYACQYWSDLASGAGGFIILNATVTSIANATQAQFKNLAITVTSNTQLTLTADAVILQNNIGGTARVTAVNVTINAGVTGANGLDTGSLAQGFYAVHVIYNPSTATIAGLLSTSTTAPVLPSGYTYFARFGTVRTDASPFLYRTLQYGRTAQFVLTGSTNTANTIMMANGVAGTYSATSPVLAAVPVSNVWVPATASRIYIVATTAWKGGTGSNFSLLLPPHGAAPTTVPPVPDGNIYPLWLISTETESAATG